MSTCTLRLLCCSAMPKRQTFCLKEERNKALSPSVCSSSAPPQHRRCEEGSWPAFLFCLARAEASATHVLGRKQMPNESPARANVKNNVKAASQPESFICLQSLRIWLSWNPSQALHPASCRGRGSKQSSNHTNMHPKQQDTASQSSKMGGFGALLAPMTPERCLAWVCGSQAGSWRFSSP